MPVAYSYSRWSTPAQRLGHSAKRQRDQAQEYAAKHAIKLVLLDADDGISAFKGKNLAVGALGRFRDDVFAGKIAPGSMLLVDDLDRLSREDLSSAAGLLLDLTRKGISVVSLRDEITYKAPLDFSDAVTAMLRFNLAHEESVKKAYRIGKVWAAKRAAAIANGKRLTRKCPAWLRPGLEGGWEQIPERVQIVQRIFRLLVTGLGTHVIAGRLNTEGVPAWGRARGWHYSYLDRIRRGRSVLGELALGSTTTGKRRLIGEVVQNYYPGIVDQATWSKAQPTAHGGGKTGSYRNLFRGLLHSAYDDTPMAMTYSGGGRYYLASLACRLKQAKTPRIRYDRIEANLLDWIRIELPKALNPEHIFSARSDAIASAKGRLAGIEAQCANLLAVAKESGAKQSQHLAQAIAEAESQYDAAKKQVIEAEALPEHLEAPKIDAQALQTPEGRSQLRVTIGRVIKRISVWDHQTFRVSILPGGHYLGDSILVNPDTISFVHRQVQAAAAPIVPNQDQPSQPESSSNAAAIRRAITHFDKLRMGRGMTEGAFSAKPNRHLRKH